MVFFRTIFSGSSYLQCVCVRAPSHHHSNNNKTASKIKLNYKSRKFYAKKCRHEMTDGAQTSIPLLTLDNDMPCLDCNCLCH